MKRRAFLRASALVPAAAALAQVPLLASRARAQPKHFDPRPGTWRTFEMTTRVELLQPTGVGRVWIPLPVVAADYQEPVGSTWTGNARLMRPLADGPNGASMLYAEFAEGEVAPAVEVVSRVRTQDRAVDWARKTVVNEAPATLKAFTASTDLMPTDGIVKETAAQITKGKTSDFDKARAVYDWIIANTYREPTVRGCGVGDIKAMLETKNFGGKCADLNGLFVGLVRAVGVPARDVYGIRVAPSAFGYRSLGVGSATISKAQHCRAEVFLRDYGWVAMDPADVAKAAREETSEWLPTDHAVITPVKSKLFGAWEGNWVGYNTAHDVVLPNATKGGKVGFLMYPQAETGEGRRDSLDPDTFKYTITVREITS